MPIDTLINVINAHQIRDTRQLTAFLTGDERKGIITPYPDGYGASLWVPRLQALRDFYGVNIREGRKREKNHKRQVEI